MSENLLSTVIVGFQDAIAFVPDVVQPLVVVAAGAVPFVEGELAAIVGLAGGLHPVVAGLAAALGNFLCVTFIVLLGTRARAAIASRSGDARAPRRPSKGQERFQRWFARFGVPGASVLGPLAIPTQFTSATLVAAGVPRGKILLWQAVAILLWTTIATASFTAAVAVAT